MALPEDLQAASWRGVPFLVVNATTPAGIKHVKHVFPNSSNQVIEELGLMQRTFNVNAVITGDDDYLVRRDRLLLALEQGGTGILIHPLYGNLSSIKAVSWSPVEDFNDLGRYSISIVFEVHIPVTAPVATENTVSVVNQANNDFVDTLSEDIVDNYEVDTSFTGNFTDAIDQGAEIFDAFRENTQLLSAITDEVETFSAQLSEFGRDINSLVLEPQRFIDSINSLFSTVNGLYATVQATLAVFSGFFDFGDDDRIVPGTTAGRIQRTINRNLMRGVMQSQSLSYSYLNASQIDFTTVRDIDQVAAALEAQYQKIIEPDPAVSEITPGVSEITPGLSEATKSALTDIRSEVTEFFRQQRPITDQVIEITTRETSTRLLSFQFFGTSENAGIIQDLNEITDVSFIKGDLEIITA